MGEYSHPFSYFKQVMYDRTKITVKDLNLKVGIAVKESIRVNSINIVYGDMA